MGIITIGLLSQPEEKAAIDWEERYNTRYQTKFIEDIFKQAQKLEDETSLSASITIAQAILESDWGRSELALKSNNLFGIKGEHKGETIKMTTDEYEEGERITIVDNFKVYDSIADSVLDHAELLEGGTYSGLEKSKNYRESAYILQEGGYATDPKYAEKIIEIIEQYSLFKYDRPR
ncbi:glycoside hydrolase family 73 protein [Brochothrix thermosphacta]|uniref:glycoside hydrolase family 73 protein n=1 Tax=Brochothrix thermosphacta TaxID=2756 RepID=UPI00265D537E|nr:glycoside hydrolase family 73 protein [Brochothrix thermosphacta]WKK68764.1 glycoside hydrolase family 73 protein [Brochothrix thermosphacta]